VALMGGGGPYDKSRPLRKFQREIRPKMQPKFAMETLGKGGGGHATKSNCHVCDQNWGRNWELCPLRTPGFFCFHHQKGGDRQKR